MIFSSFWKLIINSFSLFDDFSLKKLKFLFLKINTLQETNELGNFFFTFLFPGFYIFAKQNQTKYERHYIRKIKGIIPKEWL